MHVSVVKTVFRVYYLHVTVQTRGLKNVCEETLNALFALIIRPINRNVLGSQHFQPESKLLFTERRICALTNVNERKVTPGHFAVCHEADEFYLDSRLQQTALIVMEAREVTETEAPEENTPTENTTTVTADNEGTGTGNVKRKSGEGEEEPEKSGRGKRRRGGGGKKLKPGERYIPPPQKRNPGVGFSQEHFDETSYYFEGGLRKVRPYFFDFKTYCKGRWIGKSLLEVFSSEFRAESLDYYKAAAKEGRIRLNEEPVEDLSITLRNNDHLRNSVHRHEPPVVGRPLEVLEDNGEVLVVDKPASMPVHPCGRFRHNTVIFILGKERGVSGLHTIHRLDRLTSGVLLFARTLEVSKRLDQLVRDRQLEKEYVCRVDGEFPEGELVCEEPILVVSFKVGLCRVDPRGKACRTVFQRLSYNGSTSVVRCLPVTGRTHQIRVHLQFLGFPIVRDPVYGSSAWGPNRAKGGLVGLSDEELLKALLEEHRANESLHLLDIPEDSGSILQGGLEGGGVKDLTEDSRGCGSQMERDGSGVSTGTVAEPPQACKPVSSDGTASDGQPLQVSSGNAASLGDSEGAAAASSVSNGGKTQTPVAPVSPDSPCPAPTGPSDRDPLCSECKIFRPDPTEKELIMYLHALRYKGPDFEYQTRLPDWAKEDWVED